MVNINFSLSNYIINLVLQGKSVSEISKILNYEKSFVENILSNIRKQILINLDEDNFYIVRAINGLTKNKIKNITKDFGNKSKNKIFDLLVQGKSVVESIIILNYDSEKYYNLLKSIYLSLCIYGNNTEIKKYKDLLLISLNFARSLLVFNEKKRNNLIISELDDKTLIKLDNKKTVEKNTKYYDISSLDVSDTFKFIVISDTHFGSIYDSFDKLKEVYDYAIKNNIKHIFHTGDLIEGNYDNFRRCKNNLRDLYSQIEYVIKNYCYDKNITNHILLGNHDFSSILSDDFDIINYLNVREDFDLLGYKTAYIKIRNEYISLKHEITRIVNYVLDNNGLINFKGHSHQFKYGCDEYFTTVKVPTLSNLVPSNHCLNKGYLVCEINFNQNNAENFKVEFISFDEVKNSSILERKLK